MLPIECIVRGYLTGSAWKEYRGDGTMHGAALPRGPAGVRPRCPSRCSRRRPRPRSVTTTRTSPSTQAVELVGEELAEKARDVSLELYRRGAELGRASGASSSPTPSSSSAWSTASSCSADEVLTPDSSRFWPADAVGAGHDAAVVRQAAGARLPRRRSTGTRRRRRRRCPAEVVDGDPRPLRRGLRAHHRPVVRRLARRATVGPAERPWSGQCATKPERPAAKRRERTAAGRVDSVRVGAEWAGTARSGSGGHRHRRRAAVHHRGVGGRRPGSHGAALPVGGRRQPRPTPRSTTRSWPVPGRRPDGTRWSLSPIGPVRLRPGTRLVLPSPNGSALA